MKLQQEKLPKFECRLSIEKLRQLLDIVRNSAFDTFRIDVTEKGFKFNQMDASHVSLIQGRIDIQSFADYSVKIPGSFVINPSQLKNTLKVFGKKDILSITCDIEPKIVFSYGDITIEYRIFDLFFNETFKTPKLYFDTEFDVLEKTKFYNKLVKVGQADDYIIFHIVNPTKTSPSKLNFILKNNDDKNPIQRITFSTATEFYHHHDDSFKVSYHLEYLLDFLKYLPGEKIFFRMSKGIPLLIRAKLDSHSFINYWLAPRIMDNPKDYE